MTTEPGTPPASLREIAPERVVEVDVREELKSGGEPFARIMAARRALPVGGALRVRAIFEPVPLYHVMARHGLDHWTERAAADDWSIWFFPADGRSPDRAAEPPADAAEGLDDSRFVLLDVRGLEPPEPLARTLAALETLPPGKTLVQVNVRTPRFLLPKLEALGFVYEVREEEEAVRVFIERRDDRAG